MNITPISALGAASEMIEAPRSLSDRFESAFAGAYVKAGQDLSSIQASSNDPKVASDPALMFKLQLDVEHYVKTMVVTAGLTNSAVKAVETLVKSG